MTEAPTDIGTVRHVMRGEHNTLTRQQSLLAQHLSVTPWWQPLERVRLMAKISAVQAAKDSMYQRWELG